MGVASSVAAAGRGGAMRPSLRRGATDAVKVDPWRCDEVRPTRRRRIHGGAARSGRHDDGELGLCPYAVSFRDSLASPCTALSI